MVGAAKVAQRRRDGRVRWETVKRDHWIRPVLVGLVVLLVGLPVHGLRRMHDDAAADRVIVEAAWSGIDPYRPIPELYEELGYEPGYPGFASRTPAAFVVQAPSLVVPVPYAGLVNLILAAVAATGLTGLAGRQGWKGVALMAGPILAVLWDGNIAFFYMFLVAWSLHGRQWWRGLPLGVVAAVRMWPGLIILALWLEGRRRLAAVAGLTAVGLNLAGLHLVSFADAVDGLVRARDVWKGDTWPIWLLPLLAVVAVVKWRGAALPLGIVASPITWVSYYLSVIPQVVRRNTWGPLIVVGVAPLAAVLVGLDLGWVVGAGGVWLAWEWRHESVLSEMSHFEQVGRELLGVPQARTSHLDSGCQSPR